MPVAILLALLAGALLPAQAATNARLGRLLGSPIWAASVSGAVLTVTLLIVALVTSRAWPRVAGTGALPWWAWTGGLCGAVVLAATAALAPRLGAATMIATIVAGQVLCSIALDHFGLLDLAVHPITPRRAVAAMLLIAGAILIK